MRNFLISLLTLLSFVSCTTRQVEPTRASRRAIDTIFQKQVLVLQPQFDSICNMKMDSFFQAAVDSMITERRSEMLELVK